MKITRLEDIDRKKHEEKRERLTEDIGHVMDGVFKKPKKESNWFWTAGKIAIGIVILMLVVNLVLGNIWLLRFFWGEFF